jgi:hypothetical protein
LRWKAVYTFRWIYLSFSSSFLFIFKHQEQRRFSKRQSSDRPDAQNYTLNSLYAAKGSFAAQNTAIVGGLKTGYEIYIS